MTSRSRIALAVAPAVLALAACSSSSVTSGAPQSSDASATSGSTSSTTTSSAPASSATTSSSAPAATTPAAAAGDDAKALYQTLQTGFAKVTSAHFDFAVDVAGQNVHATGAEKFKAKKVDAIQLDENVGTVKIAFIVVDGKGYAKLPATSAASGKPWTLLSKSSSNASIRSLATGIDSSLNSASVNSYTVLANAADSVKKNGTTTIAGQSVQHYSLVVDPTKVPSANGSAIAASGIGKIPVELYVDSSDRPVRVTERFTVSGKTAELVANFTKYNEPLTIKAPPASQIGTK